MFSMAILFVLVSTKFKTCSGPNALITCESVERISLKFEDAHRSQKNNIMNIIINMRLKN